MSRVSCRDWALAGEKIAGAETTLAPATAAVDFGDPRRFIVVPLETRTGRFERFFRKGRASFGKAFRNR